MQPNCPASNHVSERLLEVTLSCLGSDSSCVNRKLGRVGIGDDSPTTHLGQKQLTHLDLTGATSPSTKTLLKKTEPHFQALPGPKNMIIFYASFQIAFTCFLWTYLQICQNLPFFLFWECICQLMYVHNVLQAGKRVRNSDRMSNNHWQRDKRPGVDDLVLLNNVCFPYRLKKIIMLL